MSVKRAVGTLRSLQLEQQSVQRRNLARAQLSAAGPPSTRARSRERYILLTGIVGGAALLYVAQKYREQRTLLADGPVTVKSTSERSVSVFELGQHKSLKSCWVAIDGDVWDVTDFVQLHPGGSQILIDNGGRDVSKLFKGIHPAGTLENNLEASQRVGKLDAAAVAKFESMYDTEEARIQKARETLFGVDSVVNLSDFEKYARELSPSAAWDYYSTGVENEAAMRENAAVYDRIFFRPRVMRDVAEVDTSGNILGVPVTLPVYVSPTARNGLSQSMGEVAVTKGAAAGGILQVLSHVASKSLDEVIDARAEGQEIGWQLYMKPDRELAAKEIKRAFELGVQSIWLTVDSTIVRIAGSALARELLGELISVRSAREIAKGMLNRRSNHPITRGPVSQLSQRHDPRLNWNDIAFIKSLAPGIPIVIKGIGAWEDAVLAQRYGADAVVLSNHGGRQLDYANPPLQTLYDLDQNAPQCLRRPDFQVFVDGGIRRGTDILKALCLGANAVGVGRPFIYAATGWGPDGVEKAIRILREEMEISMRLLGVTTLDQLGSEYLNCSKL